jgi:hypothetical protein
MKLLHLLDESGPKNNAQERGVSKDFQDPSRSEDLSIFDCDSEKYEGRVLRC